MFESSSENRKSWNGRQMRLAVHSKYLKQQMKMIWKLPWLFYMEERILRKMKKSGVLAPAHILG